MRMLPGYQTTITETAVKVFGASASVWLFGSRLDDAAKGGDVDLLVKLESPTADVEKQNHLWRVVIKERHYLAYTAEGLKQAGPQFRWLDAIEPFENPCLRSKTNETY